MAYHSSTNKFSARKLAMVGVLAALVFAATWIQFPIPTPIGNTRLHIGNVMCLLAGMVLGPFYGGLAAGIGSMFFDFTNPLYVASAPFTLVFKFMMGFVSGHFTRAGLKQDKLWRFCCIGAACGAFTYVILYLGKNFIYDFFFLRAEMETVLIDLQIKAATSSFNGVLAAVASVPLFFAVKRGLSRAHIDVADSFQSPHGKP